MLNPNKFLHISDLHYFKSEHLKSRKAGLNHYEIKTRILHEISKIIAEQCIGAVLISGDLELDQAENVLPFLLEWLGCGAKVFIVFGEHDSEAMRKELRAKTTELPRLYLIDEAEIVDEAGLGFAVYGMSCKPKQAGFRQKFHELEHYVGSKPALFLTHPCELPPKKIKQLGCRYFAVGHIHAHAVERMAPDIQIGRPGHLYSLWDGNGKAWPVGYIVGEFLGDRLEVSWQEFPFAGTVRLFINPFRTEGAHAQLVIENCDFGQGEMVSALIAGDWHDQRYRGVFKTYVDPHAPGLTVLIKEILAVFVDDIFVTPSDPGKMTKKYGYTRGVFTAQSLLSDAALFDEFMERIFKASRKTQ